MKIYSIFFMICLLLLSLSCSTEKNDNIIINFWGMGAEAEYLNQLIPQFESENPGIKVKVQMIPWTAAQEKLISAYASENLPDAFQLGNTWIPQFVSLDALENLDERVEKSENIFAENYFEGIWKTNIIDDNVFGIPWYIDTRVMYYRTDILEGVGYSQPPKTWDELYDVSVKIKTLYKNEDKYAIYLPTNEWANFIIWGLQNEAVLLKNNNSYGNFSGEKFKESFEFLIRFIKEGLAPVGFTQVTNVYQAMANEYFAMYMSGPWHLNEFKKWMKGDLEDKWMTAPLPSPDTSYPGGSLAGGSSLVISKYSENKNEVWKFVEFLSRPDIQIKFYHLVKNLPAVKSAWDNPAFQNDPYMKAFYLQFNHVIPTPKIAEWEQIVFAKLQQYAEYAARGTMSIVDALKNLDKDVNTILEKRRWLLAKSEN
jgi:multiple sugar transport system substrate-binding protein